MEKGEQRMKFHTTLLWIALAVCVAALSYGVGHFLYTINALDTMPIELDMKEAVSNETVAKDLMIYHVITVDTWTREELINGTYSGGYGSMAHSPFHIYRYDDTREIDFPYNYTLLNPKYNNSCIIIYTSHYGGLGMGGIGEGVVIYEDGLSYLRLGDMHLWEDGTISFIDLFGGNVTRFLEIGELFEEEIIQIKTFPTTDPQERYDVEGRYILQNPTEYTSKITDKTVIKNLGHYHTTQELDLQSVVEK